MITLFYMGLLVLSASAQYNVETGGLLPENTACTVGFDCVNKQICVNGEISIDGGRGLITTRTQSATCLGENVCCRIPGYSATGPENQCHFNEACVSARICTKDGIIDVTGGSLITHRTAIVAPCMNADFPHASSVCCLRPYKCPEYQVCVPNNHCGIDAFINTSGNLRQYLENGIRCISDDGKIEGVCCVPREEIRDVFPVPTACGVRNDKNLGAQLKTGYGKEDSSFGEFPWQAIIFLSSDEAEVMFKCAGTLISRFHILTTANCVESLKPEDIEVRLGEYEVNSFKELKQYVDVNVQRIIIHPKYKPGDIYNIAIVEFSTSVRFDYHINPICLVGNYQAFSTQCVASGWGKDNYNGNYTHILKKLSLPLVEHGVCQSLLRKTALSKDFILDPSVTCAGGQEGVDTCTGDGGGPLSCIDQSSGQYYLAGLVSAGYGCGMKDVPGMYTNVPYVYDWIQDTISQTSGHQGHTLYYEHCIVLYCIISIVL